jgi:hypothetical protein
MDCNTTTYTSSRGQLAIAKTLHLEAGNVIIFSPYLYTDFFDNQVRTSIYLHELFHCINEERFVSYSGTSRSHRFYLSNLIILFDEYYANRKSFEILHTIYESKSHKYKKWIYGGLKGHVQTLLDSIYYETLKNEIFKFRIHDTGEVFWENCLNSIDEPLKSMVYVYSIVDSQSPLERVEPMLKRSRFINDNTSNLIGYFRTKYMAGDFDLNDGAELMKAALMSYGLKFEDTEQGRLYCHILDI